MEIIDDDAINNLIWGDNSDCSSFRKMLSSLNSIIYMQPTYPHSEKVESNAIQSAISQNWDPNKIVVVYAKDVYWLAIINVSSYEELKQLFAKFQKLRCFA